MFAKLHRCLGLGIPLLMLLVAIEPAHAGSLQVDPIMLELSQTRRTTTLRITNREPVPVTIRTHALSWSQPAGADLYQETNDVIVSPPIFTIPGNGFQVVRIGLRPSTASAGGYRIIVEEVPAAHPGTVQVALRLDLPLLAMLPTGTMRDLSWTAMREADGGWTLEAENRGAGAVRIAPADAAAATGISENANIHYGTVLPHSRRRWHLAARPPLRNPTLFQTIVRNGDADHGRPSPRLD
jgi:fimbrial chaperone protein